MDKHQIAKGLIMFGVAAHAVAAHAVAAYGANAVPEEHLCYGRNTIREVCTTAVFDEVSSSPLWKKLMSGLCNTTPIAKEIVENKDILEEYLSGFIGTFSAQQDYDEIDTREAWYSLFASMNALAGPLIQAPFFDETVSEDTLNAYREKLVTFGHVYANDTGLECEYAWGQDGTPITISFPYASGYNYNYNGGSLPTPVISSTYWGVMSYQQPGYLQINILTNNNAQCDENELSYSKSVTSETSATSEKGMSSAFTASQSITVSTSCEAEFAFMSASASLEVEAAFEETTEKTLTTSETETMSTSQEIANTYTLKVPHGATVNATQYISRVHASLDYSNDMHYDNSTTIYVYQSLGERNIYADREVPGSTLEEVMDLADLALEIMGVTVDPVLVQNLFSGSIRGHATTEQGVQVRTVTNACQTSEVPPGECTPEQAKLYPPLNNCNSDDGTELASFELLQLVE
eukprot:Clim_evm12s98 gene=Clim_evmTU12s98